MLQLVAKPAGNKAVLKCNADGNPTPDIKWFKNGHPIQKGENVSASLKKVNNIKIHHYYYYL